MIVRNFAKKNEPFGLNQKWYLIFDDVPEVTIASSCHCYFHIFDIGENFRTGKTYFTFITRQVLFVFQDLRISRHKNGMEARETNVNF